MVFLISVPELGPGKQHLNNQSGNTGIYFFTHLTTHCNDSSLDKADIQKKEFLKKSLLIRYGKCVSYNLEDSEILFNY